MIESQYTANIGKRLPSDTVRSWKINDSYAGGVPDAFYRHRQGVRPLWVEYKLLKALPKRPTTIIKPDLSLLQLTWLKESAKANELTAVIVGCESIKYERQVCGVILTDPDEWTNGITAEDFERRCAQNNYNNLAKFIEQTTLHGEFPLH